jgi:hypothetical protein
VLAHQNTTKQSSNDYTTSLTGLKFKIAHKRAGSEKWSATPKTQRKRMIMFLQNVIADLKKQKDKDDMRSMQDKPASRQHNTRKRPRAVAKPVMSMRRRVKRVSARRRAQRTARVGGAQSSRF